ncbi:MAG TPA: 2-hydroxyacid dehydrogenase [Streptosporangiaceae bacterium]|jgi:D-3-phosphoglycerate dehydrogenase
MTTRVLAAGDHFVLPGLLADAVRDAAAEAGRDVDVTELTLPWPIEPFGPVAEVNEASGTEEELIAALRGVEVCVTQMAPLTERILAASPELRLFGVGRGGPVNADLAAATAHGVAVSYAPGRNATATAEHTLGMILSAARRIPQTHADLTAGRWRGDYYRYDEVGIELAGSTVGLVGCGAVGGRVAGLLAAFGAHVLVFDPYLSDEHLATLAAAGAERVADLDDLLGRAQVISLHARATPQTAGMIGAAQLAKLPPSAIVVNCARGSLLDYDAVCDAIDAGRLFGAAFDVFPEEPIPAGSRLLTTPGIVLTPHLAGASKQTAANAAHIVASDVGRYLRGKAPVHCANPEALPTVR